MIKVLTILIRLIKDEVIININKRKKKKKRKPIMLPTRRTEDALHPIMEQPRQAELSGA